MGNDHSNPRVIAVGDVHGEYEKFRSILLDAKLIDSSNNWIGGNTILVQTGDVIDRGPKSIESIELIRSRQVQAPKSGGKVVRLFGNHELMLLEGNRSYVNFLNLKVSRKNFKKKLRMENCRPPGRMGYGSSATRVSEQSSGNGWKMVMRRLIPGSLPLNGWVVLPMPPMANWSRRSRITTTRGHFSMWIRPGAERTLTAASSGGMGSVSSIPMRPSKCPTYSVTPPHGSLPWRLNTKVVSSTSTAACIVATAGTAVILRLPRKVS